MTDAEFISEIARHLKAIILAVARRFGVDLIEKLTK
jgi:hypothetical protein